MLAREDVLMEAFVTMADTLVDEFDVIDFMETLAQRCVELLTVTAAGIMLTGPDGKLLHVACSSEEMRVVELLELQFEEGPCFDAFSGALAVQCGSPGAMVLRWPRFAPEAVGRGFVSVAAVPMRLRSQVIGALNLFTDAPDVLDEREVRLAQALADIATIGLLQERAIHDAQVVAAQLQGALLSRVVIEQAKGIVAEHLGLDVEESFTLIRSFARSHNRRLSDTARQIVERTLLAAELKPLPADPTDR